MVASLLLVLSSVEFQAEKLPVSPKGDRDRVTREIRELFKAEYAKRDSPCRVVLTSVR